MNKIEVYSMPLEDRNNPYFELWRRAMASYADHVELKPVNGSLFSFALRHSKSDTISRILCIHWSTVLYGSRFAFKSLARIALNFPIILYLKYRGGFKVVWVIHNAHAHDYPHPWVDHLGRAFLGTCADALVAQQQSTKDILAKRYPRTLIRYIPHGNYIGAYGDPLPQNKSRFGFDTDSIVLLSLGGLRPYKRIEKIIEAFRALPHQSRRLLIAGKGDPAYVARLQELVSGDPRIRIEPRFVPDEEIPAYFAAADYSVLYYDDSELTSGALILSLSYGVPVITRAIAAAEAIRSGENGYVFTNSEQLQEILAGGLAPRDRAASERARASVEGNDWSEVARLHVALYEELARDHTRREAI